MRGYSCSSVHGLLLLPLLCEVILLRTRAADTRSIDGSAGTLDADLHTFMMALAIAESMHEAQRNKSVYGIAPGEQTRRSLGAQRPCEWPACTFGNTYDPLVQGIRDRYWVEWRMSSNVHTLNCLADYYQYHLRLRFATPTTFNEGKNGTALCTALYLDWQRVSSFSEEGAERGVGLIAHFRHVSTLVIKKTKILALEMTLVTSLQAAHM